MITKEEPKIYQTSTSIESSEREMRGFDERTLEKTLTSTIMFKETVGKQEELLNEGFSDEVSDNVFNATECLKFAGKFYKVFIQ